MNEAEREEFKRVCKRLSDRIHRFKTFPPLIKLIAGLIACAILLVCGACSRLQLNEDLINAALQQDTDQAKHLIAWGANVNGTGLDPDTPSALAYAVCTGNRKMVDLLLQAGADVNLRSEFGPSYTPLMVAVVSDNVDIAGLLIARGADVNARAGEQNDGKNILAMAKSEKAPYKQEFITLLKQAGAKE